MSDNWIHENFQDYLRISYKINKKLFSTKSKYQKVEIYDTKGFGKMLLNDDLVMITERDEFSYHEMISHVPLFSHPNPKKVLVIGGGDGGTVREVIRHNVECYLVEIDSAVIDGCKEFIPKTSKALLDEKVKVFVEDGVEFVKNTNELFDIVLIDSTDPLGPATPLFGEDFYKNIKKILLPNGIVVAQGESPFYNIKMQKKVLGILKKIFNKTRIYNYNNLTYPGGFWSFWYASDTICPINDFDEKRVKNSKLNFSYYNTEIHKASFCLPQFMKEELEEVLTKV